MEASIWIAIAAFVASLLTFFSGFGLGTILLPVIAYFLPLELAILGTAIVHLCNGLFKSGLMVRHLSIKPLIPFILASLPAAWLGANLVNNLQTIILYHSPLGHSVSVIAFLVGMLLIVLALDELLPSGLFRSLHTLPLWIGGLLSGFFGGLSGTQGALRSAFLIKLKLEPLTYVAAGSFIALTIDLVRLPVYMRKFGNLAGTDQVLPLISAGVISALLGAFLGRYLLKKITLKLLQWVVGAGLMLFGLAMIIGWIG